MQELGSVSDAAFLTRIYQERETTHVPGHFMELPPRSGCLEHIPPHLVLSSVPGSRGREHRCPTSSDERW